MMRGSLLVGIDAEEVFFKWRVFSGFAAGRDTKTLGITETGLL